MLIKTVHKIDLTFKRLILLASFLFFSDQVSFAQLSAGDVMFVGFNADGTDGFAFVALAPIPAGTTIFFTDNNWNGTVFLATEGVITWNSGASLIPAGTVIVVTNAIGPVVLSNLGSSTLSGAFNLTAAGESIYAFLGTSSTLPTTFLSAFSTNGFLLPNTLTGTGLVAGTNAISITGTPDVCVYVPLGPCSSSIALCAAEIANGANWSSEDGIGDQSNNGGIDFPTSVALAPTVSVLPIELVSFEVNRIDWENVRISWQTASELNNHFFVVEKSTDGFEWKLVQVVEGAGNSEHLLEYEVKDRESGIQVLYYRLSQTDFDGKTEYFSAKSVASNLEVEDKICFPNPTTGIFTVLGENLKDNNFDFFDNCGRNLSGNVQILKSEKGKITFQLHGVLSGVYFFNFSDKTFRITVL